MDNERAMTTGLGLSIQKHLFFADSSFCVVSKEKQFVHSICIPTSKKDKLSND
jgi:hypothetical protein